MLRKTATQEGKDWDRLIPFLLFAYREVPQESTGFSPFEMQYGRDVRGPLDILRGSWEGDERSDENIVSYILLMRERMEKMWEEAQGNMEHATTRQKRWYDQKARERSFQPGEEVLVLLPTSLSKLTAQWQGPYKVEKAIGKVNYLVQMPGRRKVRKVFHVNMLQKWHTPVCVGFVGHTEGGEKEEEIPCWKEPRTGGARIGNQLATNQTEELQELLGKFKDVFQTLPGHTNLAEHRILVEDVVPVRLSPYRIPHAYRETVRAELKEMLDHGVIERSASDWASPLVTVGKKDGGLRLCVGYRRLNKKSKMNAYPIPWVDELIDRVGGAYHHPGSHERALAGASGRTGQGENRIHHTIWTVSVSLHAVWVAGSPSNLPAHGRPADRWAGGLCCCLYQ